MRVWSQASFSGLIIQSCSELWCRSQMQLGSHIAVAVVWSPSVALKRQKKKKKKGRKKITIGSGGDEFVPSKGPQPSGYPYSQTHLLAQILISIYSPLTYKHAGDWYGYGWLLNIDMGLITVSWKPAQLLSDICQLCLKLSCVHLKTIICPISVIFLVYFFFLIFFGGAWHMKVPRLGVNQSCSCQPMPQPQQCQIQAASVKLYHSSWKHQTTDP